MKRGRNLLIGAAFLALLAVLGAGQSLLQQTAEAQPSGQCMAPRFEVDPTFPKPLPDGMYQGQSIGLWVDNQDHVWIVHRPDVLDAVEGAARQEDRRVLQDGAADSRVRPGRHAAAALGR